MQPAAAYYHRELGEFILPYEAVRTAPDPESGIRAFIDSTYDRAADARPAGIARRSSGQPWRCDIV